eukprot:CAMPEP_0174827810 /NCGR_PEP_ID=MMETSP1114-20130205/940_1 /TAXON_ID=312471 /ORGANISM="Neobodo designis, Strain CCAP 1951/1" /LENGTH=324 /DNA_ID=CAMNT_0016061487 /DNA_START=55 /DNA_END=1029 /DNA_ORIENTATION=+
MGCADSKDAKAVEGIEAFFGKQAAFKSHHGTYLRAHEGADDAVADLQTKLGDWETWSIEDAGEGKIFIKSAHGTYLRAHERAADAEEGSFAKVDLAADKDAAGTKWEAVAEGEKFWRVKSAHGAWLRAEEGEEGAAVNQQANPEAGEWENWTIATVTKEGEGEGAAAAAAAPAEEEDTTVKRLMGHKVTVKSAAHGTFLKANSDNGPITQATEVGEWEVWRVCPIHGQQGMYSLKNEAHGTNVRPNEALQEGEEGNPKVVQTTELTPADCWSVEVVEGDTIRFVSAHGTYLRAADGGADAAVDLAAEAGEWEAWTIAHTPQAQE